MRSCGSRDSGHRHSIDVINDEHLDNFSEALPGVVSKSYPGLCEEKPCEDGVPGVLGVRCWGFAS